MKISGIGVLCTLLILNLGLSFGSQKVVKGTHWNKKFDFIYDIPPIFFHYYHGVLAGSYQPGQETAEVSFNDVSSLLGHVCLCGAGGYRISQIAVNLMKGNEKTLEKGEFTLVSSRDHTVSDVIAYVLGCSRRNDPEKKSLFH